MCKPGIKVFCCRIQSHRKGINIKKIILNFVQYLHIMIKTTAKYFNEDLIYCL